MRFKAIIVLKVFSHMLIFLAIIIFILFYLVMSIFFIIRIAGFHYVFDTFTTILAYFTLFYVVHIFIRSFISFMYIIVTIVLFITFNLLT